MIYRTICTSCALFNDDPERDSMGVCEAFPDGIPDEILRQGFDHRNEFPGDNGIRFVPDGPVDTAKLDAVTTPVAAPGARKTAQPGGA